METFLAVCRLGSYTRAAEELNITQPAVTQHIQHLQTYYGVRLLDYRSKRLTLTPEGELLRRAALTMRHDEEKLKRELADLRQGRRALRFGATLTVGEYLLPPRLAAYLKANPDVELHMTVDNTRNLLQKLNAGELDFAVVEGYFRKSEYDYIVWSLEEFLCVCGADSPLAGARPGLWTPCSGRPCCCAAQAPAPGTCWSGCWRSATTGWRTSAGWWRSVIST